ncbi:MAG: class I SAM-dependent methyltransferase [Alphaproteobacteria bacterium]
MTTNIEDRVARHYARHDLERVILDALVASGKDVDRLTPDDLAAADEFHTGGREATVELVRQMAITPDMHVLDIGCGIGGASRFVAAAYGCRVTGIDLTDDYVRTAAALARRLGLTERVAYKQASASALPFEDATFDAAYMMHVGMNIEDKPGLFTGVRRVLKSGGQFAIYDVMRTGDGELRFPLHWAADASTSFVEGVDDYRRGLEAAGFEVIKQRDRGDYARAFFHQVAARIAEAGGPPPLGTHLLMREDVPQKFANAMSNLDGHLIAPIELICRAVRA